MVERIEAIREEALAVITAASEAAELEEIRVRYLGRKADLTAILRGIGELEPAQRGPVGKIGNEVRNAIESLLTERLAALESGEMDQRLAADAIDITLPGTPPVSPGHLHLLTRTRREIEDVFVGLGYRVMEGPEIEHDYYNFTALNHPPGHPARMLQDTFYVDPGTLSDQVVLYGTGGEELSLEELFDLWLMENPAAHVHDENVAAVNAAIRDFKNGDRGTLAPAHSDQLRREYGVAD